MSLNYEDISEEEVTDLICSLLSEWETKQEERIRDGEDPDMPNWQDMVNACREFVEISHMNSQTWSRVNDRKEEKMIKLIAEDGKCSRPSTQS